VKPSSLPTRRQQPSALSAFPAQAEIRRDPQRGTVTFLKAPNLSQQLEKNRDFTNLQDRKQFAEVTHAFFDAYRAAFRLDQPAQELKVQSVKTDDLGLTHVHLQQVFQNIPVWAAELRVHLDKAAHVYLAQGRYIPTPQGIDTKPALTQQLAIQRATEELSKTAADCQRCQAELVIFAADSKAPRLAYRVLANISLAEGWEIMADAQTGAILQKLPTVVQLQH
jgi:Zn-dependent metalloprotease